MAIIPVKSLYLKKIKESGLTEADGKKLKYAPLDIPPSEIKPVGKGFVLPYFDLAGKPTKFFRYRYLEDIASGFGKHTVHKLLRYVQPRNTLNEPYYPPFIRWASVAKDTGTSICITEGELKAACATKNGVATIGLGGVWTFQSNAYHESLPPSFEFIEWKGRTVSIAFDSDAATNPQVVHAQNTLAKRLGRLGAVVLIATVPALTKDAKTGVDDFIVSRGIEEFKELLTKAEPYLEAKELRALNEEVVYVRNPGIIVELASLQKMAPRAFVDHAYSTRIYRREVETGNGVKIEEKSAPKEWLKWPARAEVQRITYAPAQPRITYDNELNVWVGWGVEPEEGDVTNWHRLMDSIFQGEPEARAWFEKWCAYPLQHPGEKMYTCVLLWGTKQGTGKSIIGYTLKQIYGDNWVEIKDADLHGSFNDWAESKQFVMGDEISGGDKRGTSDRLKSFITQQQLRINQKYVPVYTVPDRINYLFTSNHPDAHYLEDDDRRNFIHEVKAGNLSEHWFSTIYDPWYKSKEGAGALFHYLLNLDLDGFTGKSPALMTTAKKDMIAVGRSDLADWVSRLKESPDDILRVGDETLKYSLWRAEELMSLYDPEGRGKVTINGLARELRRQGFERLYKGQPVHVEGGSRTARLWAIRNRDKLTAITHGQKLGEMYDKERR
jgi:hypothetical protein